MADEPLYPALLGPDFDDLPKPVRDLHRPGKRSVWRGLADIDRGGVLANLVCAFFRFPKTGRDVPVELTFTTDEKGRETWARDFGGRKMVSTQELGLGRDSGLLVERFGPFAFAMKVDVAKGRLSLTGQHWRLFGVTLPKRLIPGGIASEEAEGDDFRFHVEITAPIIGRIVRYRGHLQRAE